MNAELTTLLAAAAGIGLVHTILGPDHYLPFVAMSKARDWSFRKTLAITAICGVGHVAGSVVLGLIGVALGVAVTQLTGIESIRGDLAAYGLIAFGLVYLVWGVRRAYHGHGHSHILGSHHQPHHQHDGGKAAESSPSKKRGITPWVLFTIFVFGPCEPLIPILMYPAAMSSTLEMLLVALVFAAATIGTMLVTVTVIVKGIALIRVQSFERYAHALAGFTILACGVAIFLGL